MFDMIQGLMDRINQVLVVFAIALSLLQCFLGYKLLKFWVSVIGFLAGFSLGFVLTSLAWKTDAYLPAAIGIAAGLVLALLAFKLYLAGVFIFCGSIAFGAVRTLPFPSEEAWKVAALVLALVAFVAAGLLAVKFSRPCIIAITAVTGAVNAVHSLGTPVPQLDLNANMALALTAALATLGILIQFLTTRRAGGKR